MRCPGLALGLAAMTLLPFAGCERRGPPDTSLGVSRRLADERVRRLADVEYDLELRIPAAVDEAITGRVTVAFDLEDAGRPVVLDFEADPERTRAATVNERSVDPGIRNGHLVLPAVALAEGRNTATIEFVAGDGPLNRNDEFLYTLFVPERARRGFPLFDQPDLKARYRLTLEIPADWRAVSNAPVADSTRLADGRRRLRFGETAPISSYLFAFAAGRFQLEQAERAGRTLRLFHRETDSAKVARNLEAIFDLHGTALTWLEGYTEIPYPFQKFDFVAIPSFQYGGMEHPGSILYRASRLFLEESATQDDELGRASLIAHETAHMWFGDLVTMRWFDDVWMKEVFANFMAAKIVHPSFPDVDHELRFLLAHYPAAYAVDRSAGANPIRQELDNLAEAGTLYGAIIYQKAPIVMRHLERLVGEEALRDGLREYLRRHRFGNAGWPELIEILDRRAAEDLAEWSKVWVEEPGRPTVSMDVELQVDHPDEAEGRPPTRLTLRQSDPRGRGVVWIQPLTVVFGAPTESPIPSKLSSLRLDAEEVRLEGVLPAGVGSYILANGEGVGYGYFQLTRTTRGYLMARLPRVEPPTRRAVAWLSLWDEMLEGRTSPTALIDLGIRWLEVEQVELLVSRLLDDLETAYWRFLLPEARRAVAKRLEPLLWSRVQAASTSSLKALYFRGYRSIALSEAAVERLSAVWRGDLAIDGLSLSERDRTTLALALAVREAPGWAGVLDRQEGRIDNPDRRARFRFVRPAVSAEPAVRDSFFAALAEPSNRAHEPWVLEGVSYLHHPLRATWARRYIRPSLAMLEEIQRTGDIFFPKRWLDATLGGHSSPEAAAIVSGFLAESAALPPRLRGKLLQSADLLFRASRLRRD